MSILYLLLPIAILFLIIAIAVFFWAIRNGQYDDMQSHALKVVIEDHNKPNNEMNKNQLGDQNDKDQNNKDQQSKSSE